MNNNNLEEKMEKADLNELNKLKREIKIMREFNVYEKLDYLSKIKKREDYLKKERKY